MERDREFGYELLVRVCRVAVSRLEATRREFLDVSQRDISSPGVRPTISGEMRRVG
jgi:hypothetical protein